MALLDRSNGNRRARRLTLQDVEATVLEAVSDPVGYAWHSAGDSPDARSLTAVCLAVRLDDEIVVGASSARGAATPASAWHDIPAWNVVNEGANALVVRSWARRRDADRIRIPVSSPSPSTDEGSLRAQILASPEDDGPRQVLADLLTEQGDPRGEFIAVQLQLARENNPPLAAQAQELLTKYGAAWAAAPNDVRVTFRRGFVDSVESNEAAVSIELSELCAREPVTSVRFVSSRRFEMHSLSLAPWLSRIRALEFAAAHRYGAAVTADGLEVLLESPSLRRLERLVFRDQPLGDAGAAKLAEHSAAVSSLKALVLQGAGISARGARLLAGIRWLPRLEELSLADNPLQVQGVEAVVANGSGRAWKSLNLSGTTMGNAGAFVLSRATRMTQLQKLFVGRNRIGPAGLNVILDAAHFKGLVDVEFGGNPIGAAGRTRLAARFGPAPHRVDDL
ncbi:MAG: TIGR02996 domain-containing protein [Archangium sp.]